MQKKSCSFRKNEDKIGGGSIDVEGCGFGFIGMLGRCRSEYSTIDLSGTTSHRIVVIMSYRVGKVILPEDGRRDILLNHGCFDSSRTAQT